MTPTIIGGKRARIVGKHLGALETKHKKLTPQIVVDDARNPDSPIHSCFEWNNSKAAEAYRLWQARQLMGTVKVIYDNNPKDTAPVRGLINVRRYSDDDTYTREYMSTAKVLTDAQLRIQVLDRAKSELIDWRDRYRNLNELAAVFAVIDKTVRKNGKRKSA